MDTNERHQKDQVTIDKNSQINVVLNTPEADGIQIDLVHIFHTMKLSRSVYAWLIILCIMAGLCAPLLLYQINDSGESVSSVVTLDYYVDGKYVEGITAPDGSELDLTQILSSYVLSNAMDGLDLSQPISISSLRSNLKVERVLTDSSRRLQEIAARMQEQKNQDAFTTAQNVKLTYQNKFVVSLSNGFSEEDSKKKVMLKASELSVLLNRVLTSYNNYLFETYADQQLPPDEFVVIDSDRLDTLECLDQLRTAISNLYSYCESKQPDKIAYRSWKTGYTLTDLMNFLQMSKEVDLNYLYSYIYLNSITKDKDRLLLKYQYRLRNAERSLDNLNENIVTVDSILKNYKNDEIVVTSQDNDLSKVTSTPTDYFNRLVMQQVENYKGAADIKIRIDELKKRIERLDESSDNSYIELDSQEEISKELDKCISHCRDIYNQIKAHMEEMISRSEYTTFINSTNAASTEKGFLSRNLKRMIIGGVAGALLGFGWWFMSALAVEFNHHGDKKKDEKEEVA